MVAPAAATVVAPAAATVVAPAAATVVAPAAATVAEPAAAPVVDCRCTRGELGAILGQISLEVYIRVTSPESPHMGPAYASKKPIRGGGVSIYVTMG